MDGVRLAVPFPLDAIERPHRLTQRECDCGPYLQDREVIAHQGAEGPFGLVVGGVRLEHEVGQIVEALAEVSRLFRPVVDDPVVIELHPGLHHETDDAVPGAVEAVHR